MFFNLVFWFKFLILRFFAYDFLLLSMISCFIGLLLDYFIRHTYTHTTHFHIQTHSNALIRLTTSKVRREKLIEKIKENITKYV